MEDIVKDIIKDTINEEKYISIKKYLNDEINEYKYKNIMTNRGVLKKEPSKKNKKKITQMIISSLCELNNFNIDYFGDFTNLIYLQLAKPNIEINFKLFENVKVLVLDFEITKEIKLLNLPNIEILIFTNCYNANEIYYETTMLNNLPSTLKKIIFLSSSWNKKNSQNSFTNDLWLSLWYDLAVIEKIENYIKKYNLSNGCEVYLILNDIAKVYKTDKFELYKRTTNEIF